MDLSSWLTGLAFGAVLALVLSSLTGKPLGVRVPNVVAASVLLPTYAVLTAIHVTPALFLANVLAGLSWFLTDRIRKRLRTSGT